MADGWLAGWIPVMNPRSGGGTYATDYYGYPYRIILHTMESRGMGNPATHQYPPHLWYNPATREKVQTVPLDRAGFALYQGGDAPHYTNKARALQVELVGYAEEAGSWPDQYLVNIAQDVVAPLCQWVASQGGRINLGNVPLPGAIPNSAREDAPQRFDPQVWADFDGLAAHRHVPMGDDHWDTGALDLRRIARYAAELLGSGAIASEGELTVAQIDDLNKRLDIIAKDVSNSNAYAEERWKFAEATEAQRLAKLDKVIADVNKWAEDRWKFAEAEEERRHQALTKALAGLGGSGTTTSGPADPSTLTTEQLLAELQRRAKG
jgi:hypothetical protein